MRPLMLLSTLCLCLFGLLTPSASAHDAKDMLDQQDLAATPPVPSSQVAAWLKWVKDKQGGEYERSGGQPFAAPQPPNLPANVEEFICDMDSGTYTTSSGGVICTVSWFENILIIKFVDGSQFVWIQDGVKKECSDGSKEHYVKTIGSAGVEDPGTGAWSGWIRSSTVDMLQVKGQQKARFRAPAGGTLDLSAASTGAGPWIGPDVDEVDIAVGPGGVLDLRQNSGAGGPLFQTGGPVLILCDQILMDPGVTLADLFVPPPIVLPGSEVHELELIGPAEVYMDTAGVYEPQVRALNLGNVFEPVQLSWGDPMGWSQPVPSMLPLAPFELTQVQSIPVFLPPGTPVGSESLLQVQALYAGGLFEEVKMPLRHVDGYNPATVYCTAKLNSLGCTPRIFTSGNPTLSGYDDMYVLADNVLNGMVGILFWGVGPASIPFQAGNLCVQSPLTRTPGQGAGGNPGLGSDCSGVYSFHFSHAYLQSQGFAPGMGLWSQYWTRDPSAAFGSGLSDAVELQLDP